MEKRRRFLLTVFVALFCFPKVGYGQEWRSVSEKFKSLCFLTREAIADLDRNLVIKCRNDIENFYFDYCVKDFHFEPVDSSQVDIPLSECQRIFEVQYLDSLLAHDLDFAIQPFESHSNIRGDKGEKIHLIYKAIPAGKVMSYTFDGDSTMNLVLITAQRKDVKLTVSYLDKSFEVKSESDEAKGVKTLAWDMPVDKSPVILTIENPSRIGVTCVIALN